MSRITNRISSSVGEYISLAQYWDWTPVGLSVPIKYTVIALPNLNDYIVIDEQEAIPKNSIYTTFYEKQIIKAEFTLLNITTFLVNTYQRDFFDSRGKILHPLKVTHIAKLFDIDPVTIYRNIRDVYIRTDFGVFELEWLFDNGCRGISVYNIKQSMLDYGINFSGSALIEKLYEEYGINFSLRTILKYKKQLKHNE